jgi:hypothetical protein
VFPVGLGCLKFANRRSPLLSGSLFPVFHDRARATRDVPRIKELVARGGWWVLRGAFFLFFVFSCV